ENTTEGVHTRVFTRMPSSQELDVCVRVGSVDTGLGYGGEFAVTPTTPGASVSPGVTPPTVTPTVGVPTTDSNGGLCNTTTPNQAPGTHPLVQVSVLGVVPVLLDSYLNSSAAWVCVQVGS